MKNKNIKRVAIIISSLILMISYLPSFIFADAGSEMNISIRIEGISGNFYDQTISIPYVDTLTVQEALEYADTQSDDITITGVSAAYITDINGDTSASFGGWDGWMYSVNSVEAAVGIDGCLLQEDDSILLYYGDPFGVGMQYPLIDDSGIDSGILKFTSNDTTYDSDWNPVVASNPIKSATVTWYYEDTSATFTTDANGEVIIPQELLLPGTHRVQIEKYGTTASMEKYLPLVLRLSSDEFVTVADAIESNSEESSSVSSSESQSSSVSNNASSNTASNENVPTGDSSSVLLVALILFTFVTSVIVIAKKRQAATK